MKESLKSLKEDFFEEDHPDCFQSSVDKMIYNRQFLLQFQPTYNEMPEGLQYTFMDLPELQREPFTLVRGNKSLKIQNSLQTRTSGGQKVIRTTTQPKTSSQILPRRAKDRWEPRPSFLKDEKDQVLRSITGILNRITPEKFDKLTVKLCEQIGSIVEEDVYTEAVSLVFMKAVSESNFSKMYAELCLKLNLQPVAVPGEKITFRRVLLNKCQDEFESAYMNDEKRYSRRSRRKIDL